MTIAMVTALGIVILGLIVMARGGEVNTRWSNRLMRYRIYAQMVAVTMFALGAWLSKSA
ncbi:MAG: HIG1 domain-containing protein [Alphaproteobacteria bacterium]|nr:HIG1 domain-containing protein [Alphaproteobacteria bacterium]